MKSRDVETRQRIFEMASRLFAEHGFHHVTVRDICRDARANLAAVNYHFGDKLKLYVEIVQALIAAVRQIEERMREELAGRPAAERLEQYIANVVSYATSLPPERRRMQRLFGHEFNQPTEASAIIVARLLKPRLRFLNEIVAELIERPIDDPLVRHCTGSLMGQFVFLRPSPLTSLLWDDASTPATAEALARHIFEFSLAGIRAFARRPRQSRA